MDNKEKYGEVFTPLMIVDEMLNNAKPYIEEHLINVSKSRKINILDVGTGDGKFIKSFVSCYPELSLEINFYGIEMNPDCETIFKENLEHLINDKRYNINFIRESFTEKTGIETIHFDLIMGNPPFNNHGFIKVPCNNKIEKTKEGKSIWHICIKKSIDLLSDNGFLLFVSPCLWLKPDKSNTYEQVVNKCKLCFIKNYDSHESHKLFKYKAQTPVNYFLTQKINESKDLSEDEIEMNETKKDLQEIVIFDILNNSHKFNLYNNNAIPTHYLDLVNKAQLWMKNNNLGNLSRLILKSNPVDSKKYGIVSLAPLDETYYKNIKTCIIDRDTKEQIINYEYSKIPCPYYKSSKIFCAHKRLPEFHADYEGNYGISKRDSYVITEFMLTENYAPNIGPENSLFYLRLLYTYLNHEAIKTLCMCTKYRMNFLEKYAYEYIPNIVEYFLKYEKNHIISRKKSKTFDYELYVNTFIDKAGLA